MGSLAERRARFAHKKIRNGFISVLLDLRFILLLSGHFMSPVPLEGPSSTEEGEPEGQQQMEILQDTVTAESRYKLHTLFSTFPSCIASPGADNSDCSSANLSKSKNSLCLPSFSTWPTGRYKFSECLQAPVHTNEPCAALYFGFLYPPLWAPLAKVKETLKASK